MLKWIHKHGGAIETIVTQGGIAASEAAFTALLCNHTVTNIACLKSAYLVSNITSASMTLLGCLTSVTKVDLRGKPYHASLRDCSLFPLQGLPDLSSLALAYGTFDGLGALAHLTSFFVSDSHTINNPDCAFATSLVSLVVRASTLAHFHAQGLSACSHLRQLEYSTNIIGPVSQPDATGIFQAELLVLDSLSAMTALTSLHVTHVRYTERIQFQWLRQLPSLQSIKLEVDVRTMIMHDSLSGLSKLTALYLSNRAGGHISFAPFFRLSGLVALQVLNIKGFVCLSGVVNGLETLKDLTHISFLGLQWADMGTVSEMQLLGEKLSTTRPDVIFDCKMKQSSRNF